MTAKYIATIKTADLLERLAQQISILENLWIRDGDLRMSRFEAKDCVRMIRELRKRGLFV